MIYQRYFRLNMHHRSNANLCRIWLADVACPQFQHLMLDCVRGARVIATWSVGDEYSRHYILVIFILVMGKRQRSGSNQFVLEIQRQVPTLISQGTDFSVITSSAMNEVIIALEHVYNSYIHSRTTPYLLSHIRALSLERTG